MTLGCGECSRQATPLGRVVLGQADPRSWVFEGSMDGKEWFVVDSRENSRDLNGS